MRARAVCLAGPTASGKSALALALARERPIEIISVDSALVYRGMDIGTAKPTAAERALVPHHLIDILEPTDVYSAARFATDAQRLVNDVCARGRLPLLVGGTLLYFKALRHGLHTLPAADAAVRAEIDQRARQQGWPALHAELARIDPATAARLPPADAQRIQRALEVWQISGRSLSDWHSEAVPPGPAAPQAGQQQAWPLVSMEPQSRAWLHQRITRRFETMLAEGLVDEVLRLRARADLHLGLPAMRCVGYRQTWEALDAASPGQALDAGQTRQLLAAGSAATRQLAKRQLTWLRSMSDRQVVPCDAEHALELGLDALLAAAA